MNPGLSGGRAHSTAGRRRKHYFRPVPPGWPLLSPGPCSLPLLLQLLTLLWAQLAHQVLITGHGPAEATKPATLWLCSWLELREVTQTRALVSADLRGLRQRTAGPLRSSQPHPRHFWGLTIWLGANSRPAASLSPRSDSKRPSSVAQQVGGSFLHDPSILGPCGFQRVGGS